MVEENNVKNSIENKIGELMGREIKLGKDIEGESSDIKNIKEELDKIGEYIKGENQGIGELVNKRKQIEMKSDEINSMINILRDGLLGVDKIMNNEKDRIKKIKEHRKTLN